MKRKNLDKEKLEEIEKKFQIIDENSDGLISFSEIKLLIKEFDLKISDNEIKKWFKKMDINKDGKVNYDEFMKMFE